MSNISRFSNNQIVQSRELRLGLAVRLLAKCVPKPVAVDKLFDFVWPPIILSQSEILQDQHGHIVAFGAWASFSPGALRDYLDGTHIVPPLGDWNGGAILCVTAFFAPYGHAELLTRVMKDRLKLSHPGQNASRFRRDYGASWRDLGLYGEANLHAATSTELSRKTAI